MGINEDAVERVMRLLEIEVAKGEPDRYATRPAQLAILWPSLAAALGDLAQAYGRPTPASFRVAQRVLAEEYGFCYCLNERGGLRHIRGVGDCQRKAEK